VGGPGEYVPVFLAAQRMKKLSLRVALASLLAIGVCGRLFADDTQDLSVLQAETDALATRLADIQAHLEDVQPDVTDQLSQLRSNKYGGSTDPAVSGDYGALFKDAAGFGLLSKNGSALFLKLNLDIIEKLPDASIVHVNFGPALSPGQETQPWNVDDPDEEHVGLGTSTRLGTLMSQFQATFKKGAFDLSAGFMSFSLSPFTVSGALSDLPYLFDMNVYRDRGTSKSFYDGQFMTGVPVRDPTESTHPIMGVMSDYSLSSSLSAMAFMGNFQNYYTDSTMPHEYGGDLVWDGKDSFGGIYKLIGYNHSNDSGEILTQDGSLYGYFGLMNNTVVSLEGEQKLGRTDLDFEFANSRYDDSSGINGVHVNGQAWRLNMERRLGDQVLRMGVYGMAPDYLVTDPEGYYNNDGGNLPRYREDPSNPGKIIPETVVADPTIPMNNTITEHIGLQLRHGNTFLNLKAQVSQQMVPSDAQIWASHYEGGSNLGEGTWFVFFNNNYQAWLPPDAYLAGSSIASPTSSANNGTNPYLERQFDYNQNVAGPTPAFPTTEYTFEYNNQYAPSNATTNLAPGALLPAGYTTAAPGAIYDVNNRFMYNAYHDIETDDLWRSNMEGIVNTNKAGYADAPSAKSIYNWSGDMRMNLSEYMPLQNRACYWQVFSELLTVDDQSAPCFTADNLFMQSVVDSTLIYNMTDNVNLLLNMGSENWVSDRISGPDSGLFLNQNGTMQNPALEYHDKEAGVGVDWNFLPNKLNVYLRCKILEHEDSYSALNCFEARQLWFQIKSYF
jgi:hypothetical protein